MSEFIAKRCQPRLYNNTLTTALAEKLGYYLPWNLGGAALSAIGYGLLSTLKPTTPAAKWIGYQIIYGVGSGSMISVVGPLSRPTLTTVFLGN